MDLLHGVQQGLRAHHLYQRDVENIVNAAKTLGDQLERTPCRRSRTLSALTGAEVWLKFENHQFTASFKERGALNKLRSLNAEQRQRGVIAMSAGNHAQGVALAGAEQGAPVLILMPSDAPAVKIANTRALGADVILYDRDREDRELDPSVHAGTTLRESTGARGAPP